ncbi:iron(III) transport system permease protein [Silvimonas terrae]|uniref:Iron(III) transport system permease protein n=1 Tax=Silvimonas terrae TaxID=300266 RepID=A0A840RE76_9NEIS|nr:iron ABC transporter permease [Silvimonas terrae]MBB5190894.1 iron(III) transport system permease protein [Silvimonas terrae]
MSGRRYPPALVAFAAIGAVLVLVPLLLTLRDASQFSLAEAQEVLLRPLVGKLLFNTLTITLGAMLVCAVVGTLTAWFVERTQLPGRRIWSVLVVVPLAIPPFVSSYAWVSLSQNLQDYLGALLVVSSSYYPLVYLPVAAALRGMDPALEETARSLGLGRWSAFVRVVLPQLRPALLGGSLLVALGVLAEFGAFALLRFRTFTTEIYAEYRTSFDSSGAALLACVLIGLCLLCVLAEHRVRGQGRYFKVDRGTRRAPVRYALGRYVVPVKLFLAALVAITILVPLGMIVYWLTQEGAAAVTPADVSPALLWQATSSSLELGLLAAALTTLLAIPLGYLLARHPGRLPTVLERVVYLAQGLPGLVVALALVTVGIGFMQMLYQSTLMLVVGYAILFLPLALVGVRAAFVQAQPRLEESARALGLSPLATWLRVILPLAAPGIGAAATLVFVSTVTELTATLLLSPIGTQTLATQVWADTSTLAFAAAAPYAALLAGLSLVSTWVLMSLLGRSAIRAPV